MTRFYIEGAEEFYLVPSAKQLLAEPPWHYRRRPNCSVGYALRCKGKEGA